MGEFSIREVGLLGGMPQRFSFFTIEGRNGQMHETINQERLRIKVWHP